jgi:hypothetical protein
MLLYFRYSLPGDDVISYTYCIDLHIHWSKWTAMAGCWSPLVYKIVRTRANDLFLLRVGRMPYEQGGLFGGSIDPQKSNYYGGRHPY